jgi:hypothetical protein
MKIWLKRAQKSTAGVSRAPRRAAVGELDRQMSSVRRSKTGGAEITGSAPTVRAALELLDYDAPLLKGRFRMHQHAHPFDELRHVDLLHPVRRAYRGHWENCRLQTIERELLGIVREDDLPGSEAPAAWLSFLRGGSSRNLARVAEHNRQDLITLASLLERLSDSTLESVLS